MSPLIDTTSPTITECVKILIVGAGAAGLECAHTLLTEYGFKPDDILILEARNRIGGRIHSTTLTRTTCNDNARDISFSHDYGAAWVHGTGYEWRTEVEGHEDKAIPMPNPMMTLLHRATPPEENVYDVHLKHTFTGNPWIRPIKVLHEENDIALYVSGQLLDKQSTIIVKAIERYQMTLKRVSALGNELFDHGLGMEMTRQNLADTILKVQEHEDFKEQLLNHTNQTDRDLIASLTPFYFSLIECWYGVSTSALQLCEFVEDEQLESKDEIYTPDGGFFGPHCKLKHGMATVLGPLLEDGVNGRILLEQEVVTITKSKCVNDEVHIIVKTAAGQTISCDTCVLTLPIGCLQHVANSESDFFCPKLNPEKLNALSFVNTGSYKKVLLTFDHIFWPKKEKFIGLALEMKSANDCWSPLGRSLLLGNFWARDGIPCLEALLFGSSGTWAKHRSNDEIASAVLDFMSDAMGQNGEIRSFLRHCEVTRWEEDPFSRGAYSSVALGAVIRHAEELKKPDWGGRLLFAGEAYVSSFQGSVHAALFSGQYTAKQVYSFFNAKESDDSTDTESAESY